MHRLAAEEFADRRAQHRAAIGVREYGVRPAPFSCSSRHPLAGGLEHLAQRDGAAVAQLARPVAELVPAVIGRDTAPSRPAPHCPPNTSANSGAGRRPPKARGAAPSRATTQSVAARARKSAPPRDHSAPWTWRTPGAILGIARQFAHEGVVEPQRGHRSFGCIHHRCDGRERWLAGGRNRLNRSAAKLRSWADDTTAARIHRPAARSRVVPGPGCAGPRAHDARSRPRACRRCSTGAT